MVTLFGIAGIRGAEAWVPAELKLMGACNSEVVLAITRSSDRPRFRETQRYPVFGFPGGGLAPNLS